MIGTSERRSAEFMVWEANGRGHRVYTRPVALEPPGSAYLAPRRPDIADDGRKPTALGNLVRAVSRRLAPEPSSVPEVEDETEEAPRESSRGEVVELRAHLPPSLGFDRDAYAGLFASLEACVEPIAFEIVATSERIAVQFAVGAADEYLVRQQFGSFLPDAALVPSPGYLETIWGEPQSGPVAIVDFGLAREFMIPFSPVRRDPFIGLAGALDGLREGEAAVYQVLFAPASRTWRDSILRSVTHADGSALFVNAPELLPGAKEKTAHPLYAAVLRLGVKAEESGRAWQIACDAAAALGTYGSASGNELIPLHNGEYPEADHAADLLKRESRRSGMILNASELAGFVHLPTGDVRSKRLRQFVTRTKAAPECVRGDGLRLGTNDHAGTSVPVCLTEAQRASHVYAVGSSGTGKSTLLFNMARRAIEAGEGISILDPHGDLIDQILAATPDERTGDVVLLDPSDAESVVAFNVLSAHSDSEKSLLASDLVAVFRRLSDAWGHQLGSVLSNALIAFMESDRGGTLLDVRRFLLEPAFRSEFLKSVRDPEISYYWKHAFPQLAGNRSVGPVVTRLDAFLAPKAIRAMVGQRENRIDFRDIMGSGRIFLARLSQGTIGRENARLLGGLIVAKIQAEAMSRQRTGAAGRRLHSLLIDEFHDFLTPSLSECLTGVRKYGLGLVLAHQERSQLTKEPEVASAVLSAGTRIVFRVNETDARSLAEGFADFDAKDLISVPQYQAICRVERSDFDFNLALDAPEHPGEEEGRERRERIVEASRTRYGVSRAEAERALLPSPGGKDDERPVEPDTRPAEERAEPPRPPLQPVAISAPKPAPAAESDLGKGGAQHKAIQDRIKEEAERLGYRVTVEREVPGGQIDLVLACAGAEIACEVILDDLIQNAWMNDARRRFCDLYHDLKARCMAASLPVPHENTLRKRLARHMEARIKVADEMGPDQILSRPLGSLVAEYPLEIVQMDHTKLDVFLVDEVFRLPLGRPWLTVAIDVATRVVLGFYLSFDSPSANSVGLCLYRAMTRKAEWLRGLGVDASWPMYGMPVTAYADNAKEFRCDMLSAVCEEYGIHLQWRPVRKPRWGGHIERLMGNFAGEMKALPGATFSNVKERGDYDSEAKAVMTIKELEKYLISFLCDTYHQREHSSLGKSPYAAWQSGTVGPRGIGLPRMVADELRLRMNLLPSFERTISEYGVVIDNVQYYSDALRSYIGAVLPGRYRIRRKFQFRRDPRVISVLYFLDPESNQFIEVPYRDTSRPAISIWELRAAAKSLDEEGDTEHTEEKLFAAVKKRREIVADASRKTRRARRDQELRRRHGEDRVSLPPRQGNNTPPPSAAIPLLTLYSGIRLL